MTTGVGAIVLAGGEGRRMGGDKRGMVVAGRPLLTTVVEIAAAVADEVIVSCRRGAPPDPGLIDGLPVRVVFDESEGGPLAGLEASLAASASDLALVLAVDMPDLTPGLLEALVKAARANPGANGAVFAGEPGGRAHLPAALRRSALPIVTEQLAAGSLSIRALFDRLDMATLPMDDAFELAGPDAFRNLNCPADVIAAERALGDRAQDRAQ
jgi:molybdopterin-guanine dinucleotide biosynthesis protein A